MNKKFFEYFNEKGFQVEKNSGYGSFKGYEVNIAINQIVVIHISSFILKKDSYQILKELKDKKIKFAKFYLSNFGLFFEINDFTMGKLVARLDNVLDDVISVLQEHNILPGYCPACNEYLDMETSVVANVNGLKIRIDQKCYDSINEQIDKNNVEYEGKSRNYLNGLFGALIGGVVGMIIAVVLYFIGFFASIAAFVSVLLGSKLYVKFGGKQDKVMPIIIGLTTLFFMVLWVFVVYGFVALQVSSSDQLVTAFNQLLSDPDVKKAFTLDLVMSLLFSILGIGYQIKQMFKNNGKQKNI